MRFQPKRPGGAKRIKAEFRPPCRFIAMAMELAMMAAAEGYGKLVADLATERTFLREAQMMSI